MTEMERYRSTYGEFNKELSAALEVVYQKVATRTPQALNYMTSIPKLSLSDDYDWVTEDIDVVLRKTTNMFNQTKKVLCYLHAVINDVKVKSWLDKEKRKIEKSINDVESRLAKIKEDGSYRTQRGTLAGSSGVNNKIRRDETIKIRIQLLQIDQEIMRYNASAPKTNNRVS